MQHEISLFGPVNVDGERVRGAGAATILAELAIHAPAIVSTGVLTEVLWSGSPPATSRKILQKYVSELRRMLGRAAISTVADGYRLDVALEWIDIRRFERCATEAIASARRGQTSETLTLLTAAIAQWSGSPFVGCVEAASLNDEARRLGELRLTAIENVIELEQNLGVEGDFSSRLEELAEANPYRERLWAALMLSLYRNGRQADALAAYRRLRAHLGEELGIEPSTELQALEERILLHDPVLDRASSTSLPAPRTSFVGRRKALADVPSLLERAPLVTLVGAGGAGKTRLSVELASRLAPLFDDGARFVDLTTVTAESGVDAGVAEALSLAADQGRSLREAITQALADKELLLVVDNAEHVVGTVAALAHDVLALCRRVRVLVTSREALGLTGEVMYSVAPLEVPGPGLTVAEAEAAESVALFVDRARAADPEFVLTKDLVEDVVGICRVLDGLPLAVELTARQVQVLSPAELRARLAGHLDLLTAPGEPDARHRTMRAAIDWSHHLLSEDQRLLFEIVSVFPGSFTVEAAEHVAGQLGVEEGVLTGLSSLVNASMVVRTKTGTGSRFRVLEPLRAYAAEHIGRRELSHDLARAHATWILGHVTGTDEILGPHERKILASLDAEHHHFGPALLWSMEHDQDLGARLLIAWTEYLAMMVFRLNWAEDIGRAIARSAEISPELRGHALARCALALADNFSEFVSARQWAEEALVIAESMADDDMAAFAEMALGVALRNGGMLVESQVRVASAAERFSRLEGRADWATRARHSWSMVALLHGDYELVHRLCDEMQETWNQIGTAWGTGKVHWLRAAAFTGQGEYERAEQSAEAAHSLFARTPDVGSSMHVLAVQGDAARLAGDPSKAEEIYHRCLRGFQEISDRRCTASTMRNLGMVALQLGRLHDCRRLLWRSLEQRREHSDDAGVAECIEGLGLLAAARSEPDAVDLLAASSKIRADAGAVAPDPERLLFADAVTQMRAALEDAEFDRRWQSGLMLDVRAAAALAERVHSA